MATTLKQLKTILKNKVEALVNDQGKSIFGAVFSYAKGDFKNYPVAVVANTGASGEVLDTHRNERTFHFTIDLYQEESQAGRTPEEADEIMTDAVDAVLLAFDTDRDLSGQVEVVRVVEANFDFRVAAGTFNFATLKID